MWKDEEEVDEIWDSVELVRFVVYVDFIVELCAHRALLIYM